ncbi:uncharacterized protein LOC111034596 [Myzus persicae]|uniref:uncharacterized protein LOC111034596 n=1 Tax=Myzus persicae TaxID=13164 RepID=UPI000B92FD7A|nr:uncharacterized protein LOC111034596 [Myzus persicae]XP_022171572.1 uncharacterized protein LOC111034596 [Myzus persicae]
MPCRYQPGSLLSLSEDRVVSDLVQTCYQMHELARRNGFASPSQTFEFARHRIRPFWTEAVPALVRRQLLTKCMAVLADAIREGHSVSAAADNVPLYLLGVMLDGDVRELRVQLCCYYGCSHQTALLKLLAQEARGLASLELVRPTLLRLDTQLFQSVLLSMSNLKRLVLKNIACDKILKTIGQSCSQLEVLDISHSSQVTDNGIKHLLLQIEIKDKSNNFNKRNSHSTTKISWWHVLKTLSKKIKVKTGRRNKLNDFSFLLEYCQKSTKLCSTLNTLNIANTSVTSNGILIALQNIPNLETLGEYCHIGKALELLDKSTIPSTKLQLTMANACRTTSSRLQVLCNTCTKLNRLTITEPLHSPLMLSQLPKTLTIINLQNVPTKQAWLDGLYTFLVGPQSKILKELFLKFRRDEVSLTIDLSIFLPQLANLETLSIDGVESSLYSSSSNITLRKLEKIQLSKVDHPNTLQRLIEYTPELKVLHVYTCLGLNSLNFIELLNSKDTIPAKQVSKSLNCLYINDLPHGNINTVKYIIDLCPEINKIGNISNWDISQEEIKELNMWKQQNNFKLELHANSHWFCSECFPIL